MSGGSDELVVGKRRHIVERSRDDFDFTVRVEIGESDLRPVFASDLRDERVGSGVKRAPRVLQILCPAAAARRFIDARQNAGITSRSSPSIRCASHGLLSTGVRTSAAARIRRPGLCRKPDVRLSGCG